MRRGPWMKMLLNAAQTLPLFVGKVGEKPPPLCGAIPADSSYTAKVRTHLFVYIYIEKVQNLNVSSQYFIKTNKQ